MHFNRQLLLALAALTASASASTNFVQNMFVKRDSPLSEACRAAAEKVTDPMPEPPLAVVAVLSDPERWPQEDACKLNHPSEIDGAFQQFMDDIKVWYDANKEFAGPCFEEMGLLNPSCD